MSPVFPARSDREISSKDKFFCESRERDFRERDFPKRFGRDSIEIRTIGLRERERGGESERPNIWDSPPNTFGIPKKERKN
jgi:hypothetical protein